MRDTRGRHADRLVVAATLCVLVATVPGAVAAADEGVSTAVDAPIDHGHGASGERPIAAAADRGAQAIDGDPVAAVPGETLPGSVPSQLFGALLVLLVLAGIGVAAWGVRPDGLGRLGRAPSVLARVPRSRVGEPEETAGPGESLLTDEERIIELVEANGGRLKQQHVVEATDWSKAKVSRLLSSMEDDDAIVRIQLGREKLIFLSGQEPRGARSVHREER